MFKEIICTLSFLPSIWGFVPHEPVDPQSQASFHCEARRALMNLGELDPPVEVVGNGTRLLAWAPASASPGSHGFALCGVS